MARKNPRRVVTDLNDEATIPLPTWTDSASVISYATSLLSAAFAVITALHPGYTEPPIIQALLPSVGVVVAGVAQIVNVITHRAAQKAAIVAQYAAFGHH